MSVPRVAVFVASDPIREEILWALAMFPVTVVSDAAEADIVIFELGVAPGLAAFLDSLRRLPREPEGIVVLPGDDTGPIMDALRAGARDVLVPPYSETLGRALQQLLRGPNRSHSVSPEPEPPSDAVQFSTTAPPAAAPVSRFLVDVWAHTEDQRAEVLDRARQASPESAIQLRSRNAVPVARGSVLTVQLHVEEAEIAPPEETMVWSGSITQASFVVTLSGRACRRLATARICAAGLEIARVQLLIESAPVTSQHEMVAAPSHRKAFASYARPDIDQVLARIQGMQKENPGLEVFLDVLSLRSGQDWHARLWKVIPQADIFYLFWSGHAAASEWVRAEWKCALETRGLDFIDPVPLCSATAVPPPPELAAKHFDDWMLGFHRPRSGQRVRNSFSKLLKLIGK